MLARLRDVEKQLWRAKTAVQLHVRLARDVQEKGEEEEEQVTELCRRVEKVQDELLQATCEMLQLARKATEDDGDETETEDEMEEAVAVVCGEQLPVQMKKEVRSWEEEEEEERLETGERKFRVEEGEEARAEETHAEMEVADVIEYSTLRVEKTETSNAEEMQQHEEPLEEVRHEEEETKTDEEIKEGGPAEKCGVSDMEERDAADNSNNAMEGTCRKENDDYMMEPREPLLVSAKTTTTESESNGDETLDLVKHTEQERAATSEMADNEEEVPAINAANAKQNTKHVRDISDVDKDVIERIACTKQCSRAMKKIESSELRHCLQTGIGNPKVVTTFNNAVAHFMKTIMGRDSKFNSRLWIERLLKASRDNFVMTSKPEFRQSFIPVLQQAVCLQKYCDANYPDLQDMLYDVKAFEYLTQNTDPDGNELCILLRFLLDQLKLDCTEYCSKPTSASGSVVQWCKLKNVCNHLVLCIRAVSPDLSQFPAQYLTETIRFLGEFDANFPKTVPMELLESLICMATKSPNTSTSNIDKFATLAGGEKHYYELQQKAIVDAATRCDDTERHKREVTIERAEPTATICVAEENPTAQLAIACDTNQSNAELSQERTNLIDSSSKKRPRLDLDVAGPALKKPMRSESLENVHFIAQQYCNAAHVAVKLIAYRRLPSTDARAAKAISDLKILATEAMAAFYDYLKKGDALDQNTVDCVCVGTDWLASTICGVPGNVVEYTWLLKTTRRRRQIFDFESYTPLRKSRDSLSASIDILEAYLRRTYILRKGAPVLKSIEIRIRHFQSGLPISPTFKALLAPIQSISDRLMKHLDEYTALEGRCFIQSDESWARIMVIAEALAEWMSRALQCRVRGHCGLFERMLTRLQTFERHYPARLPPVLLSNARLLSKPSPEAANK